MPGAYLAAILVSAAGVAALDLRWRLVAPRAPGRTAVVVLIGTAFFLAWDLAGIAAGVFRQGDSAFYLGISLGPQLPLEEAFFVAFLCYLALVVAAAADRVVPRRAAPAASDTPGGEQR
ncbi:lycopene cyclase domain-containing protein [Microbacterium sp. LRZ72]|uniref:lycopene cyclase domain-containing protein n=1 Tax=Microbacterium sp. LRZ72 TaxID=2942481 RepID=UPI0029BD77EC|nr:lycopene cyclase domain-containing protein [Microbacterium sp. LRZ72]MDX2375730.1 lycopene cyclase domain-containing protein [Microbacterium sp. LRZ72]